MLGCLQLGDGDGDREGQAGWDKAQRCDHPTSTTQQPCGPGAMCTHTACCDRHHCGALLGSVCAGLVEGVTGELLQPYTA